MVYSGHFYPLGAQPDHEQLPETDATAVRKLSVPHTLRLEPTYESDHMDKVWTTG